MNPYNVSGFYDPNPWEELRMAKEARLQESDCTSCGHAAMCPHNSTRYCVARINCPSYRPK